MHSSAVRGGGVSASVTFAIVGVLCVVVYGVVGSPALAAAAFAVVGVGGCVSMLLGPRMHGTSPDRPWRLIVAASAVFLVGALVRPWAAEQHGLTVAVADAFTLPGYALLSAGIAALLLARNGIDRHALLDGLLVCIGAGLVSMTVFALPAVRVSDRPVLISVLAGIYPLLDVLLLLLLVNLAFTTAVRQPSFRLLAAGVAMLLAGDLGYAVIGARGELSGPAWLDLPFLGCYVLFGCAALHPSMVDLGRALPRPVQAWSWRRLVVLLPALAIPSALTVIGSRSDAERVIVGVAGATMVALLLVRAATAVTAYSQAQEVFRYQAMHDGLTGLPNRVAVTNAVEHLIGAQRPEGRPVWLFFLDLDGFKLVNDSWGHDAGDRLLVEVGRRLRAAVPSGGELGRLGGDEFVVATAAWPQEAAGIGELLMLTLVEPLQVGGAEIMVSASLGMAQWDGTGTADALMRDADTAMYRAKTEGCRRRVVFDPSMRRQIRERVELEQALTWALARGELWMAYQPIVRLSDGALAGAEALMRWDHPDRGPVPPATFIPIAEEAGLIAEMGDWALRQALKTAAGWHREGLVTEDFWMSVNASPRQLRDDRMLHTVREVLAATGLPAAALVLEITEVGDAGRVDRHRTGAGAVAVAGDPAGRGRLRYRVLRAGVPAPAPGDRCEDRPRVRRRPRARLPGRGDRAGRRRDEHRARSQRRRRGRGDRRAAHHARRAGRQPRSRLVVGTGSPGRGVRAAPRRRRTATDCRTRPRIRVEAGLGVVDSARSGELVGPERLLVQPDTAGTWSEAGEVPGQRLR